jgi:putative hydrolase of the HAD superfamily
VIRYALFDLDDTLYPPTAGVLELVGRRIERYLVERLHMEPAEAARVRVEYRNRYGTTLGGLLADGRADAEDYLAYVHDVPVEELVRPSSALDRTLAALPWERVILTNSCRQHAERVLAALGVRRRFSRIFDITGMGYRQKPHPTVYRHVLAALGVGGDACLIADDALCNLTAAKGWGMTTIWVRPDAAPTDGVDYCIPEVRAIDRVAAQIEAQSRAGRGG